MRGPSWLDADGTPVFTYYEEPGNSSRALLVRATFLREFLTTHKLELVALHWFQRMELTERHDGKHPELQSAIEARLGSDLAVREGEQERGARPDVTGQALPSTVRYQQPGHLVGRHLYRSAAIGLHDPGACRLESSTGHRSAAARTTCETPRSRCG